MKTTALVLCALFVLAACHKTLQPPQKPVNPDSTLQPVITPAPVDSAMSFVVFTRDLDTVLERRSFLQSFTIGGGLQWTDDFGGEVLSYGAAYGNNTLYPGASYFAWLGAVGSSPTVSYGKLYALNAGTGAVKWSYLDSNFVASVPALVDTTLILPELGALYGFGAGSGQMDFATGVPNGLNFTPVVDGNTMFVPTASLYAAYYSIVALDIPSHSIIWTTPIGVNPPAGLISSHGLLVLTGGTQDMMALDESTGSVKWTVGDQQYSGQKIVVDSVLIVPNNQSPLGLYGFDLYTGALRWQWNMKGITVSLNWLYQYGKTVYVYGLGENEGFLQGINPLTGDSVSHAEFANYYSQPVYAGHSVYALTGLGSGSGSAHFYRLDAATFAPRDSVVLQGYDFYWMHVLTQSGKML